MNEARRLLHEAELRQLDLEAQNEALRATLESLQASREYYFDLYEMAPVGYLQLNRSGMILQANGAAALLLGLDLADLKNRWFSRLIVDQDQETYVLMQARLRRSHQAQSCELRLIRNEAPPLWVNLSMEAHTETGEPFLHIVLIDITQRKQAQAALLESQERFRTMAESTPDAIIVHRSGRVLHANPAALRLLGASSTTNFVGEPVLDRIHPDFREIIAARMSTSVGGGIAPPMIEIRLLKLDGTTIDVELQGTLITYEGESAFQVSVRDITERKRASQALRIAAVAFECQECMLVLDAQGSILRVNQAFTEVTGYSELEAKGQSSTFLHSVQKPHARYTDIWNDIRSTGSWQGTVWRRRKDGSEYLAQGGVTAVRDEQGQVTHYVINFIDATRKQQDENQRIADETAHREMLVREVHHRIKNNLQGVMGLLRRFASRHPETDEPLREAISQVQSISIIHGLKAHEALSRISVFELTSAVAKEIQALWQTPITLAPCADAARWSLREDDAVPIALVLNELLSNAVKHGGQAAGNVSVVLDQGLSPEAVQIRIVNAGKFLRPKAQSGQGHCGLQLISALMPRNGARLTQEQQGEQVVTLLDMEAPVVFVGKRLLTTRYGDPGLP